jgi:antitoxin component HigA of HigAB toxin-antitoxin module
MDGCMTARICDKPATHIDHGIGGRQPCCAEHARYLHQRFGISAEPIINERANA